MEDVMKTIIITMIAMMMLEGCINKVDMIHDYSEYTQTTNSDGDYVLTGTLGDREETFIDLSSFSEYTIISISVSKGTLTDYINDSAVYEDNLILHHGYRYSKGVYEIIINEN
jgi:hypothetical protein